MKSAVWAGESIDRFIPPYLRNTFYKSSNAQCKYARNNGIGAYDFPTNGLVLWLPLWALNNGGTNSIQSVDAFRLKGTIIGALWGLKGRPFDGTDDKISCSASNLPQAATNRTVQLWVKNNEPLGATGGGYFFGYGGGAANKRFSAGIKTAVADVWFFGWSSDFDTGINLDDSNFHFLEFTYDGTNVRIYKDLVEGSASPTAKTLNTTVDVTYPNFDIGCVGADEALKIDVGEVWVYSRVLSAGERERNNLASKWRY